MRHRDPISYGRLSKNGFGFTAMIPGKVRSGYSIFSHELYNIFLLLLGDAGIFRPSKTLNTSIAPPCGK